MRCCPSVDACPLSKLSFRSREAVAAIATCDPLLSLDHERPAKHTAAFGAGRTSAMGLSRPNRSKMTHGRQRPLGVESGAGYFMRSREMSFFKIGIGLLAVLATSGFCASLAEDNSLEYKRVTATDLKWSPLPSMPKGRKRRCSMAIQVSLACTLFASRYRRIRKCLYTLTRTNAFASSFRGHTIQLLATRSMHRNS
jgi:hypothetical protein